jgi:hypothetical protein
MLPRLFPNGGLSSRGIFLVSLAIPGQSISCMALPPPSLCAAQIGSNTPFKPSGPARCRCDARADWRLRIPDCLRQPFPDGRVPAVDPFPNGFQLGAGTIISPFSYVQS